MCIAIKMFISHLIKIKWKNRSLTAVQCAHKWRAGGVTFISYWIGKKITIFEDHRPEGEELEEEHFRSCYTEASGDPRWFSLTPSLSSGDLLPTWFGFWRGENFYLRANSGLSRALFFRILQIAEGKGASKLYMAVYQGLEGFSKLLRVLICLGFKQVGLETQRQLCSAPAVLFERKLK